MKSPIKKIGFIFNGSESLINNFIENRGGIIIPRYKKLNLILRILRKYHFKSELPFKSVWYSKNENRLKEKTAIIVFDSPFNDEYIKFLSKKFPNKKIIYWYWNPVRNSIDPRKIYGFNVEKWSYSMEDCKSYDLKYNNQFFFQDFINNREVSSKNTTDICFVGKDKGRLSFLLKFKKTFDDLGLNTNFHIVPTKWYDRKKHEIYKKDISYSQVLEMICQSNAILDVVKYQSDGLTLRVMESLFFEKKLITNNKTIVNYDFYSRNNIFILGVDNIDDLVKFVKSPYKPISKKIINQYEFNNWLERFNL